MLKKTVTYTDYEGVERTEDFYFNLTKAEVTMMELSEDGGLIKYLEKIVAEKNGKKIIEAFKDLVLKSYGEKSPDGKRFIKNQALRDAFEQTEAYSEIFTEMVTDADAAAAFMNAIIPQGEKIAIKANHPALNK